MWPAPQKEQEEGLTVLKGTPTFKKHIELTLFHKKMHISSQIA